MTFETAWDAYREVVFEAAFAAAAVLEAALEAALHAALEAALDALVQLKAACEAPLVAAFEAAFEAAPVEAAFEVEAAFVETAPVEAAFEEAAFEVEAAFDVEAAFEEAAFEEEAAAASSLSSSIHTALTGHPSACVARVPLTAGLFGWFARVASTSSVALAARRTATTSCCENVQVGHGGGGPRTRRDHAVEDAAERSVPSMVREREGERGRG